MAVRSHSFDICSCFNLSKFDPTLRGRSFIVDCNACELKQEELADLIVGVAFTNCSRSEAVFGIEQALQPGECKRVRYSASSNNQDEDYIKKLIKKFQQLKEIKKLVVSGYDGAIAIPLKFFSAFENLDSINYTANSKLDPSSELFSSSQNVSAIILSNNKITLLDENLIKNLVRLEHLDLSHNQIVSIPDDFFNNSQSLKILNMSFNSLVNLTE